MSGTLSPAPWLYFTNPLNGQPLSGGKLYVFAAGTSSTPEVVHSDQALLVPHSQPIILDAGGRVTIYLGPTQSVKYVLYDSSDVLVRSQDGINSVTLSAELSDALAALRAGLIMWPGSDSAALMGTVYPSGSTKAARAPGTGLFTLSQAVTVNVEATVWADAGATATFALFASGAPDTVVSGSELSSSHADGARVITSSPITLAPGTYFCKGHSAHASAQAFALAYRIVPTT